MSFQQILQNESNNWADIWVHNITCNSVTATTGTDSGATAAYHVGLTGTLSATGTFYAARQGNIVSLNFLGITGATGVTGYFTSAAGAIGAEFRPVSTKFFPCNVTSGGTGAIGLMEVNSDGSIQITGDADANPFVPGNNNGVAVTAVSYNLVA